MGGKESEGIILDVIIDLIQTGQPMIVEWTPQGVRIRLLRYHQENPRNTTELQTRWGKTIRELVDDMICGCVTGDRPGFMFGNLLNHVWFETVAVKRLPDTAEILPPTCRGPRNRLIRQVGSFGGVQESTASAKEVTGSSSLYRCFFRCTFLQGLHASCSIKTESTL